MYDKYLGLYHKETIYDILEDKDENKHFSININFLELFENDPNLGNHILREPEQALEGWDSAVKRIQTNLISQTERTCVYKNHVHCRVYGLPVCPELRRTVLPRNDDANKFLQISGTVVRMTAMKMLEYKRQYICVKCKYVMIVTAQYELKNVIEPPRKCGNPERCAGTNIINTGELNAEFCKDYQEIKMQENVNKLDVGCIPTSMWVTLEDDLVDMCKPGDNITVCGTVKRRWSPLLVGKKIDIELVIKANHVQVNNNSSATSITPELKEMFQGFWKTYSDRPLAARDIILKSICPQIFGLCVVKLAVAVVLAGGSHIDDNSTTGVRVRSEPHLLLVGDPGTGKSQLLRFASKIIPRSVLTTGVGSTAAGLTVTAVMENGEWQLEGGALVLSDGGICCIDEFNSMKEHDRTSIHEAMEQQTISVAKASIVCKLSTRCSILAATNPKGNLDPSQPLSMNIALASPLLSRFDLILLLRDKVNENWDSLVADYILNSEHNSSRLVDNIHWTVETLQAYFAVIKKTNPTLTEDSNKILSSYYQAQRKKNCRNKSRTTVRLLDSLVRLSQGHARLMFHEEVQIMDAVMAVILVETSMEADSSVFNLQFDIQNDFPENPMENYRELVEIVLDKLQLNDLHKQELDSINAKLDPENTHSKDDHNANELVVTHRIESPFFHGDHLDHVQDVNDKNNEDGSGSKQNDAINVKKVKRAEEENGSNSKKIKLAVKKNDVVNDLAALDRVPSVNDHFLFLDDCNLEENSDLSSNKAEECVSTSSGEERSMEPNLYLDENEKENSDNTNKTEHRETTKQDKKTEMEELSQHTKLKKYFSKFKFASKENSGEISKQNENNSEMISNQNNKPDKTIIKVINKSDQKSSLEREEMLEDLESVPQSTQCEKFNFEKADNQTGDIPKGPQLSTTIFESHDDLDNLDLDL